RLAGALAARGKGDQSVDLAIRYDGAHQLGIGIVRDLLLQQEVEVCGCGGWLPIGEALSPDDLTAVSLARPCLPTIQALDQPPDPVSARLRPPGGVHNQGVVCNQGRSCLFIVDTLRREKRLDDLSGPRLALAQLLLRRGLAWLCAAVVSWDPSRRNVVSA